VQATVIFWSGAALRCPASWEGGFWQPKSVAIIKKASAVFRMGQSLLFLVQIKNRHTEKSATPVSKGINQNNC
jgi:hypothetical protein